MRDSYFIKLNELYPVFINIMDSEAPRKQWKHIGDAACSVFESWLNRELWVVCSSGGGSELGTGPSQIVLRSPTEPARPPWRIPDWAGVGRRITRPTFLIFSGSFSKNIAKFAEFEKLNLNSKFSKKAIIRKCCS